MKLFKFNFADMGKKLQTAVVRFPQVYLYVVAMAVMLCLNIHKTDAVSYKWVLAGGLASLAALFFYLLAEGRFGRAVVNGINVVLAALIVWYCSAFPSRVQDADEIRIVMLVVTFVLAVMFAPYLSGKQSLRWWNYLQHIVFQLVIALFFAGILMGGLSLALVSLDKLFGIDIDGDLYAYLAVFCFVLFAPSYFMAQIPLKEELEEQENLTYPHILKILGLYILLPILSVYILILYGYLLKIVVTWELPNGWVSWLVSILGFVGLLTMLIVHPLYLKGENKVVNTFTRIFPLLLIPLLILMFVGIVRRFSDYGITINRLLVLILNIWFFGIGLYLIISKAKQPKWIFISFAAIGLLAAVGPWSVINVTEKSLKKEFTRLLSEANWTNKKDYQPVSLDEKKQSRLADVAYYLNRTYGIESISPMFSVLGENAGVSQLLEALDIRDNTYKRSTYFSLNAPDTSASLDIDGYKTAIYYKKNWGNDGVYDSGGISITLEQENMKIWDGKKETTFSLLPLIEQEKAQNNGKLEWKDVTMEDAGYKLIVFSCEGNKYKNGEFAINYLNVLLLVK